MYEHLRACVGCARQDASIRRSLFLVRNLPCIKPSEGFSERLKNRLERERASYDGASYSEAVFRGPSARTFAGLASAVFVAGLLSVAALGGPRSSLVEVPRLPTVVVQELPESPVLDDSGLAAPAFVASLSTGMPVWPTLLLAEQGSLRFATTEAKQASLQLTPQH
jgi:hypothetical protein